MRSLLRGLAAAALGIVAIACSAQDGSAKFEEGKHYQKVRKIQPPSDPKRIEVAEFFMYSCPHCYAFDPTISAWAKTRPADVDFVRYPVTFGREIGRVHARAFYAAEALNVSEQVHMPIFQAIHERHLPLNNDAQLQSVFNSVTGVLPDVLSATLKGFAVDSRVRRAEQMAMDYGVTSVPTMVIGGKYVTSAAMAGSFDEATKVIDFLVDKVRRERAGG
ncbi:thiol:disulfide interchange protein DsbA/DsbL [Sinimarinibacterium thermocellulolyticum]|uniref:Thiol:disulfide interchange protein n=1 Tax=Sinimarinibacterium thermocellulolyticum TaxID=3170016 RepID=A0ABV2A717_9GAMM